MSDKVLESLQKEIKDLHLLLKAKENAIFVLKQQNLDLFVQLQKFKRKRKLKF